MLGVCADKHTKASTQRHTDTSVHARTDTFFLLSLCLLPDMQTLTTEAMI